MAGGPALEADDTVTVELLFTTGANVTTEQTLLTGTGITLRIKSSSIVCTLGSPDFTIPNIDAHTTYHFVLTANPLNQSCMAYLNGKLVKSTVIATWFSSLSGIGLGGNAAFTGVIHHCRIFSEAFSNNTVRLFWNGAQPHLYLLPESFLPTNSGTCLAQYMPRSISDTVWADTGGNGFHLYPKGNAAPTSTDRPKTGQHVITSGFITTSGNVTISLRIPVGYYADQIVFTNNNSGQMANISMRYLMGGSVIAEVATLQALATWACNPLAAGRAYIDNDLIYVTAGGNTSNGGCRVDVRLVGI